MLCVLQYKETRKSTHAKLNTRTMAKKRTINELRQTKDSVYTNPGAEKKYKFQEVKWDVEGHKKYIMSKEGREYLDIAGDKDLIEAAKEQIIKQLQDDFYDVIFQAVADKMNENYMFRQNNYLTEAGMDEFEDAWFEWYHNHHGDILTAVLKNLGH